MNRTAIRILNAGLLVLCCFLAARVVAAVGGELLAPPAAEARVTPRAPVAAEHSWADRQVILDRNFFNASTRQSAAPPPPENESLEQTKLPLRLLGTAAAGHPSQSRAAVEDLETRTHRVVAVGDVLKEQAEVVRIERRRIVLQNGPRREELALGDEDGAGAVPAAARGRARAARVAPPAARPVPLRADVQRLGENRFALPRADVEQAANNPAALFSQARILPKYEEGSMVGVQLNAIKPGSLFEQIGIQNGDTITSVNGIEVTGQQESAEVLRELAEANEFDVTVAGPDGQVRQLHYVVR
jgi:general secretion pathway protein C